MIDATKLIIVIPTYNERNNVSVLASCIFELYPQCSILFVDDNSPDGTHQVIRDLQAQFTGLQLLHRISDRGFGRSYIDGFKKVLTDQRYQYVVMMDCDFSHDPASISGMVNRLADYPVVIGSRYVAGGSIENWQLHRKLLSRFANLYARVILGVSVGDMTTGFMCLRRDALEKIDLNSLKSDGYSFLVELKYKLSQAGLTMFEYPITFSERREGQSKMSSKIIWESIWLPWKLRFFK